MEVEVQWCRVVEVAAVVAAVVLLPDEVVAAVEVVVQVQRVLAWKEEGEEQRKPG